VKYLAISALLLLVVNAAGNYVLVPKYGALGAAWVCFITQSIYAAFCLWKSFNNKAFEFRIQRLIQVSIVLLLMLISGFILRDLLHGFYAIIAVAICLPISLWISGIFKAEIQSFFTKKN